MHLSILLLLTSPLALLASSSWTITPHPDGTLDLTFATEILLKGGCPAVVIPPSTTKTSLCAGANWTAAASPPTTGVDPLLGPYTATTISYTPTAAAPTRPTAAAAATVLPFATLELRAFDDVKHDRVIHAQVRALCVRICLLSAVCCLMSDDCCMLYSSTSNAAAVWVWHDLM